MTSINEDISKDCSSPRDHKYAVYLSPGYEENVKWGGYHVTITGFSNSHACQKSQKTILNNIWKEIHNAHPYSFRKKVEGKDYWIETKHDKNGNDLGYRVSFNSDLLDKFAAKLKQQKFERIKGKKHSKSWHITLNISSNENSELARAQFDALRKKDWKLWLVREPSKACQCNGEQCDSNYWQEI